jgi:NADH-quinone oxidoreductase subunit K
MNDPGLNHYLIVGAVLFILGIIGFIHPKKNIVSILLSIELMLLSVNINMVAFSFFLQELNGQIFTMIILTVAAAETSIGLAILVIYFRHNKEINIKSMNKLKG